MHNGFNAFLGFGILFAWIARFGNARFCTDCGKLMHRDDPSWEGDLCRDCYAARNPYFVGLWGSFPDLNDDLWTGKRFATAAEAWEAFHDPFGKGGFSPAESSGTAYIEIDGPDVNEARKNPAFRPSRDDDSEWRREIARL